jgi:hypothetical protein
VPDRFHGRVPLVEDEPHLGLGVVVLVEPFAPLASSLRDECLHGCSMNDLRDLRAFVKNGRSI